MSGRDERILKDFPKCLHCEIGAYWVVRGNIFNTSLNGFCFLSRRDKRYSNGPVMCCKQMSVGALNTIRRLCCNHCNVVATEVQLNMIIELGKKLLDKKIERARY